MWEPLGPAPLRRFVSSYRRHEAGTVHNLLVLYNGFAANADLAPWRHELAGLPHEELVLPARFLDLAAYRSVIDGLTAGSVCFVNSYTEIEAEGWLEGLLRHLSGPRVGIVGAGGSFESPRSAAPRPLRPFLGRGFDPFPNPHLRTNGFAIKVSVARDLHWPSPRHKRDALLLESGRCGLTRQVLERDLDAVVVGRDGCAYLPERSRESATFRAGEQRNRLISDNRTRQYENADPAFRATLERMCWGVTASV